MSVERLICPTNRTHVEFNERLLAQAMMAWQKRTGITRVPWDEQLSGAWRAEKIRVGLKSTIQFDDEGRGRCAICNEPLIYVLFDDKGRETRRRYVLVAP